MRVTRLPKAEAPVEPRYIRTLGLQSYDVDNLYPQNVRNIIRSSKTGYGCLERYSDYIEGRGLVSDALSLMRVNLNGETLADVHSLESGDLAELNGFAIHVNYDINGHIVDMHHIPFENVRLCEPDEEGVVRQVALHPDWSGQATRGGKQVQVKKENVDYIDVFNPDPVVVLSQIQEAGGPQYYKGQVYYYSREGHMQYPFAKFHAVLTDLSTDEGLSNVQLRNVRNNFLPAGAFVRLRGAGAPLGDDESAQVDQDYPEDLLALQGDTEAVNIIDLTVESKEDIPEFLNFRGNNYDKEFTQTASETKDCIYAAFGQEGWLAIRNGKVGFSGTLVADVERDYAKRCVKTQKALTRAYLEILQNWAFVPPEEPTLAALSIRPLVELNDPTSNE
jgi:hypothetical protein